MCSLNMLLTTYYITLHMTEPFHAGTGSGSGLGTGSEFKYLTFQDLGLQAKIFRNVDDGSRAVGLPSPLNIGRQSFHTLYVRCSCKCLWCQFCVYFDIDKL